MCVHVCVCACVYACMCACVGKCVYVCARACGVCLHTNMISCVCACECNGVARIFVWGGTRPMPPSRFCVISRSRPDSVGGGGVVAEI